MEELKKQVNLHKIVGNRLPHNIKYQTFSTYTKVTLLNEVRSESIVVCISEKDIIKTSKEFNEKFSDIFGFKFEIED